MEFSCTATGVPLPSVKWYPSGGLVLRNNTLIIANVSKNDQGKYFCEAKNEAGQKTVTATVVVAGTVCYIWFTFNFGPLPQYYRVTGAPKSRLLRI